MTFVFAEFDIKIRGSLWGFFELDCKYYFKSN